MSERTEMYFEDGFLEILVKAQREAVRNGITCISDILVLKNLIYTANTDMSEFMQLIGISPDEIIEIMEKDIKFWAKEAKKEYEFDPDDEDDKTLGQFIEEIQMYDFCFDDNVSMIFNKSTSFEIYDETIDEVSFMLGMLDDPSNYVLAFFKEIAVDTVVVERYFEGIIAEEIAAMTQEKVAQRIRSVQNPGEKDEIQRMVDEFNEKTEGEKQEDDEGKLTIPKELSGFMKVMEPEKSKVSPILGREEETERLTKVLLKAKKSNVVLIGKPGVGKTAIVEDLAWRIANGKCAEDLKNKVILSMEVNDIVAGTTLRGMAEDRFKHVSDFLSKTDNVILFIDEIHNVVGAGNTRFDEGNDFANALKPILAREGVSVIGATTEEEYERVFKRDGAFKRRFEKIVVKEPLASEIYPMVQEQIRRLSKHHGVAITKQVVDFIISVSGCFNFETCDPDRTLDLIDKSMAAAKYAGKKVVSKEIVLSNFAANFKLYSKMSEEVRRYIAYHETGHYLVARYSKFFPIKARAVSIIPAEDYFGVTVYDDEPILKNRDYNACVESIARMLGGRVAEKMYTGIESTSACVDLEMATKEARSMIVEHGLVSSFSRRNSEKDFNEERIRKLNEHIDKIIDEAYRVAEAILKEHEKTLKEIVKNLMKQGVLTGENLEKICQKSESKKALITKPETSKVE